MEIVKQREIQHEFHEHRLVLVEEQSNQLSEKAYCYGCGEEVFGPCFSCFECNNFHLHQKCAEAPYKIPKSYPLHRRHSGFFLRERSGCPCKLCKEKRDMFFYECNTCWFSFDIKCAFLISQNFGENFHEFKDDAIQHQFILLENHKDELKKVNCFKCHESLVGSSYVSFDCKIHLHKKCFESFIEIDHPCHRLHTLILRFSQKKKCFCKLCQKEDYDNFFFHCFPCKFDFHGECVWPRPIINDKKYHEHPFTPFWKQDPFICNACGIEGNCLCYICATCHLQLHKHCTSLPCIIKVSPHKHFLYHKYFLKKREFEKHECQFCWDEVKTEHGGFLCLKEDCNYIVHVNCATENNDLYYQVDLQNDVEEPDDEASICVIEKNKDGEATIVKHFCHDPHNLKFVLEDDKMININGRNCDGCMLMLSISIPFYYCSECNFYLHKTCAELPKSKHHWFHRYVATLQAIDMIKCTLCNRYCSGLFYKSRKVYYYDAFYFCLRCAMVPNVIKCEGHKHLLFFDYKCKMQCNGCGVGSEYGAFRCKECNFAVDFACLTLPHEIQHKCDEHLLQLTYDHDENADDDQNYCYICEEKREPISHWYYHCSTSTCNTSAHTQCVLGNLPFIKDGITWPSRSYFKTHPHLDSHKLTFVLEVDGYPKCDGCDELCQDQTLKCYECNYFLHCKCLEPQHFRELDNWIKWQ